MKKTDQKKLTLGTETLRSLDAAALPQARGAGKKSDSTSEKTIVTIYQWSTDK
jgi:hypothetical protein